MSAVKLTALYDSILFAVALLTRGQCTMLYVQERLVQNVPVDSFQSVNS